MPNRYRHALAAAAVFAQFLSLAAIASAQSDDAFVPVTDEMLENPAPGDWLMWRRTAKSWGYSPWRLTATPARSSGTTST